MVFQAQKGSVSRTSTVALLFAAAALTFVFTLVNPVSALAAGYSLDENGNRTNYGTIEEAIEAGYSGKTIIMDVNWCFTRDDIEIEKGKSLTINLNGFKIYGERRDNIFTMLKGSSLTLVSDTYAASGKTKGEGDKDSASGVVTGGQESDAGAIYMKDDCTLTLDNIVMTGNYSVDAGAIRAGENNTINLRNKTSIENNNSRNYGAIECADNDITINMDNASISNNNGTGEGGAIYSTDDATRINMENHSKISSNKAAWGGGLYFNNSYFYITSKDRTGVISGNSAYINGDLKGGYGGAIYVDQKKVGGNDSKIEGVTIAENSADKDAGAIYLDQENTHLLDCAITNNTAKQNAGGVYVYNDGNWIDNCTITGNRCNDGGGNYTGGGVYVYYQEDIKMTGVCVIKGNTHRDEKTYEPDDVALGGDILSGAYITGGVSRGSKVGVLAKWNRDRRIGDKIKNATKDCFFMDSDDYYVSYGNDHGGDMWQRHASKVRKVQVNGQDYDIFCPGEKATVNGASSDADKVFWYWDANSKYTTGLYPVSDFITNDNAFNSLLSFKMPQNDVDINAIYADRVKKGLLAVDAPVAGEELPRTATFARADAGLGGRVPLDKVPVTWYEVGASGNKTAAAGVAKAGTGYVASVSIEQQPTLGLFFSAGIAADSVTVRTGSGSAQAASASVDAATGTLTVETVAFKTEGEGGSEEAAGTVTLSLLNGGLMGGDVSEATAAGDGVAAMAADEGEAEDRSPIGEFIVSYAEGSDSVTIVAPAKAGYNFCNWEGVQEGWINDDVAGAVTVPADELEKAGSALTAVYAPVATELELDISAPVAGKKLAGKVGSLVVKASDGTEVDLAEDFGVGEGLSVSWSPVASGKAAGATRYTAIVDLDDAEDYVDVDKVLAQDATVKTNGADSHPASGFAVQDGRLVFYATFTATKDVNAIAAKAVKGKVKTVKASAKAGKTKKAKSLKIKAAKSADGTKASFKLVSGPKLVKLNAKTGKVTLKKGAAKGKTYKAKVKVTYGYSSKKVTVKFKVR